MPKPVSSAVSSLAIALALNVPSHAQEPAAGAEGTPPTPGAEPAPAAEEPAPPTPATEEPAPAAEQSPPPAAPAPFSRPSPQPGTAAPQPGNATGGPEPNIEELEWPALTARTRRSSDAHADRVILFPTAETQPQGSFFISSYELVLIQVGYAVTDSIQMSALFLPPLVQDQPFFLSPTFKVNLVRSEQGNVAVLGGFDFVSNDDDSTVLGRLGAAGQVCFDAACYSSLSVNGLGWTSLDDAGGTILLFGAGAVLRASDHVSFLIEPSYGVLLSDGDIDAPEGFVLSYGLRLSGKQFGVDLTFVRPFLPDISDELVLGVPFVVASYRSD